MTARFGSWTYGGSKLDIVERQSGSSLDLSNFSRACPSVVQSHESERKVTYYEGLEEGYPDITMKLTLAWR